jgi:hypothetical protein
VLVLAATALPEWTVQSAEPQAEQRRPISYRNDVVPLLSKAGCNMGTCHGNAAGNGVFASASAAMIRNSVSDR